MRRSCYILAIALFELLPSVALSQEVPLEIKGDGVKIVKVDRQVIVKVDVTVVTSFPFSVYAEKGAALYFWTVPNGVVSTDKGDTLEIKSAPKGEMTVGVKLLSADWDSKRFTTRFGSVNLAVGDTQPVNPGPNPPKPEPPKPDPPTPAPISAPWVLMVYESADIAKYPSSQVAVLYGKDTRSFLNSITPYGPDGKTKEWRVWDKDQPMTNESKGWQFMMNRPRSSLPWIAIGDGQRIVHEGPLPLTPQDTINLVKKALSIPFSQRDEKGYAPTIPIVFHPAPVYQLPVSFSPMSYRDCPTCRR